MTDDWVDAIAQLRSQNESFVLVTLLAVRGSTPRDAESKMVVTESNQFDTIGGGNLEYQAIKHARTLLADANTEKCVEEFSLGASLGQCCGGHATVLFECFAARLLPVVLFGGGHVGTELATVLQRLPVQLHWLDSRHEWVAEHQSDSLQFHEFPVDFVEDAPAQSAYLLMTHDHSLDFDLCSAILERAASQDDVRLCGLIGSKSKSAKFRNRLKHRGFTDRIIDTLRCPVGSASIPGKRPMEVAVSIAAEIISMYQAEHDQSSSGINRRDALKLVKLQDIDNAI